MQTEEIILDPVMLLKSIVSSNTLNYTRGIRIESVNYLAKSYGYINSGSMFHTIIEEWLERNLGENYHITYKIYSDDSDIYAQLDPIMVLNRVVLYLNEETLNILIAVDW